MNAVRLIRPVSVVELVPIRLRPHASPLDLRKHHLQKLVAMTKSWRVPSKNVGTHSQVVLFKS